MLFFMGVPSDPFRAGQISASRDNQRENAMKRGKVLFVATVYRHLTAFHLPFMRLLHDWGYEVHAAASPHQGDKGELEAMGVTCWNIPFQRSPLRLGNIRAYTELRSLLQRERYSLIHVHTPIAAWLGRLATKRTGQGPVLYTAHGFHFYRGAPWHLWALYYPAERLAARWTDGLIVINQEDLLQAKRMGFKEGEDLFLVRGVGVDVDRYAKAAPASREALGLSPEEKVVLCVAEFTPNKNHLQLLLAWGKVVQNEARAKLLLVGEGVLKGKIEAWVREMGLKDSVKLLGFRRDVPHLLALADVVVLSSKREGLPRAVVEAMAAGKPVVATDVRGNRDLVKNGETGFLLPLGDVDGLARALLRLLGDPEMARRMGEAGQARIQAYALDRVLHEMASIYSRYLGFTPAGT